MTKLPLALSFNDVLLKPQYSEVTSRSQVNLKTKITPNFEIDFPVISVNMDCVTGIDMAIAMSQFGALSFYPRFAPPLTQAAEIKKVLEAGARAVPAVGVKNSELDRVHTLYNLGIRLVTIDIAHGHLKSCLDFLKLIKSKYPDLEVIAGVVGTYEGARDLFLAGADAVRVGVGPGSICTTRIMTGSGVPQLTAILEASRAGREFGKPIIADGGTKSPGDIVKALAAGANAVVVGSQLAGATEAPGELFVKDDREYKRYNGSTSQTEKIKQMQKNSADKKAEYVDYVEGIEACVEHLGPIKRILTRLDKGIRSGLSYSGAFNIEELHQKAKFIRVTPTTYLENSNRGVSVLK